MRRERIKGKQQQERKQAADEDNQPTEAEPIADVLRNLQPVTSHGTFAATGCLFLESPNMRHQRLNLVVTQLAAISVHFLFAVMGKAFFNHLDGVFVLKVALNFCVGVILSAGLLAHSRLALTVCAVAFGTMF